MPSTPMAVIPSMVLATVGVVFFFWRRRRRTIIFEANEGQTIRGSDDSSEHICFAFFGSPDYMWKPGHKKERIFLYSHGRVVTEILKKHFSKNRELTIESDCFGTDPSFGNAKVLTIETTTNSFSVVPEEEVTAAKIQNNATTAMKDTNRAPPRPVHYVLRPDSDSRLDKSVYVRYDPHPEHKTGAIIIVIPGGAYDDTGLGWDEAQDTTQWLIGLGITAVLLVYRAVSEGHYWPSQFDDWKACAEIVREKAGDWGCDPNRIGVLGFSAGGHLAAYAAVCAEAHIRPKLQVLVYPCIDTLSPEERAWRAEQGYPAKEDSPHLYVSASTPPAFLAGIDDDYDCPVAENTEVYAEALDKFGVPYEYIKSGDIGLEHGCSCHEFWTLPCAAWLQKQHWAMPDAKQTCGDIPDDSTHICLQNAL